MSVQDKPRRSQGACGFREFTHLVSRYPEPTSPAMTLLRITSCLALGLLLRTTGTANNIQVANATLANNNGSAAMIQFDLSWENSWRGGGVANWDAAWVFMKYRTISGLWQHVRLSNNGNVAPVGSQIDPGLLTPGTAYNVSTNPVIGMFIYRNAAGTGTLNLPAVQLLWDYSAQGLAYNDIVDVQVFAIEMVYVPQASFYVGSGGTEGWSFTDGAWTSGATIPRQITSEAAITINTGAGNLWGITTGGFSTIGPAGSLPAAYPKGFNDFYCMKYEVTQQGYADFLNTLTYTQQVTRTTNPPSSVPGTGALITGNTFRNGIDVQTPGVSSTTPAVYACNLNGDAVYGEAVDGKDVACSRLSWGDLTAYLDWSGLRPMTELEFEKACRGPSGPLPNEYPWGTSGIAGSAYTLANTGATTEGIATNYSTTLGNSSNTSTNAAINGPLRVGIFAANGANTGRVTAGASYYGIMELGGNQLEQIVTIGNTNGRLYNGTHGNCTLTPTGDPDGATWPAPTTAAGAGNRGGWWGGYHDPAKVSERSASDSGSFNRTDGIGGRGVRTAP